MPSMKKSNHTQMKNLTKRQFTGRLFGLCGYGVMVTQQPSKLLLPVRIWLPAPKMTPLRGFFIALFLQ
jgi:hypothetical protein